MQPLSASLLEQSAKYGNKASGLARLLSMGFAVPDAFVVSPAANLDETALWDAVRRWIGQALDEKGRARLAVRSSAPLEDRPDTSQAGRFKSVLGDFERSDLMQAVKDVQSSGDAQAIPVIVQVRVDAKFSGIAFSCDPVSLEREQYVLSFVNGRGMILPRERRRVHCSSCGQQLRSAVSGPVADRRCASLFRRWMLSRESSKDRQTSSGPSTRTESYGSCRPVPLYCLSLTA